MRQQNLWSSIAQTVKRFEQGLFAFIRGRVPSREDAEDVLQDVWTQLVRVSDQGEIESLSGWLYTIARNKITDLFRKRKPESLDALLTNDDGRDTSAEDALLIDPQADTGQELFRKLVWEELFKALDELPEKQRQVFVLNELEGKTLQAIADESGEKLKTIISRKQYAVQRLRARLQPLYDELNHPSSLP